MAKRTKKRTKRKPRALSVREVVDREQELLAAYRKAGSRPPSAFAELHATEVARKKTAFLEEYMRSGRVDLATRHVGILYHFPYHWARVDEEFKAAWARAREVAAQALEDAAYRRAKTGVLVPVYQKGMLVGMERRYSDGLTMFLLKGMKPDVYRDRVEHSGDPASPVQHKVTVGLSDEVAEQMRAKVLGVPEVKS